MSESVFLSLPKLAQESLARISFALEGVVPMTVESWPIAVSALESEAEKEPLLDTVRNWASKSKLCLYYFECISTNVDLAAIERAFADAKAHESNNRAYSRLNARSTYFYVGSSQSVGKRLADHLGYSTFGTYALQLLHWARPLSLELQFVCAKYADTVPYSVVQALEDALWERRAPMFGRQGRK